MNESRIPFYHVIFGSNSLKLFPWLYPKLSIPWKFDMASAWLGLSFPSASAKALKIRTSWSKSFIRRPTQASNLLSFFEYLETLVRLSKASRHEYLLWKIVHWHTLNVLLHNMVNLRNHFEWNPIFSHVSCHGHCTALHFDLSNTHSQNRSVFCFFCLTCLPKPPNRKGSAAPGR